MTNALGPTRSRAAEILRRALSHLLGATLLAGVLGAITVLMVLPRATHGSALTVLTGSMTPGIPVGSIVLVRPVDPATLEVGDVATYVKRSVDGSDLFITHRIIDIHSAGRQTMFVFKGDANQSPDLKPVPASDIRGQVWFHVPYLGSVRDTVNGRAGITLLAILMLGGYAVFQLVGVWRDRRATRSSNHELAHNGADRASHSIVVAVLPRLDARANALVSAMGGRVIAETDDCCVVVSAPPMSETRRIVDALKGEGASGTSIFHAGPDGLVAEMHEKWELQRTEAPDGSYAHS